MPIKLRQVESKADRKEFVMVPWEVYKHDPRWIPPLIMDRLETIDSKKNPFFEHGEAALFIAEKNGQAVGRISAHTNSLHNQYHNDKTGFFGFYECIHDIGISRALFERAEGWLKDMGCDKVLGPASFSTNEEVGLQVQGFDKPLMMMCPYNPPYYTEFIEESGFEKEKDLFGWTYRVGDIPEDPKKIAEVVEQVPGLRIRTVNPDKMLQDIEIVRDIFNKAWSKNWGYVPWTDSEVKHSAAMLKMIMAKELTAIAELDGKPIAMMLAFPNILEVQKDLDGKLFPFGLLKLLYRIKMGGHKFRSARLFLLGIEPEYRGSVLGGLSVLLYIYAHRGALSLGIQQGELGWTLEDNQKINTGISFMGGKNEKVYRVFGKTL